MRVLIGCESSGVVRDAFLQRGHDAWSCDLVPSEAPGPHLQTDVLNVLDGGWDLAIFHPPCTYVCGSGLHWNRRVPGRAQKTQDAIAFMMELMLAPIPRIALENPVGRFSTAYRKPNQIIQPYEFGHDASKATCLWLKNLPLLMATGMVRPRIVNGYARWGNQTDNGQNRLSPSPDRSRLRSRTYEGIAQAMAEQWGRLDTL